MMRPEPSPTETAEDRLLRENQELKRQIAELHGHAHASGHTISKPPVLWRPSRVTLWSLGVGAAVLIVTPLLCIPGHLMVALPDGYYPGVVREELSIMLSEVFGSRPDPNRMTVEWLRHNSAPSDEILINYEDLPLAFYLPNPIRGGIPAFRVEDDAKTPPTFVVLRSSVDFLHKAVFEREIARYRWSQVPVKIPDVIWGNNPDPMMWQNYPADLTYLYLARRVDAGRR